MLNISTWCRGGSGVNIKLKRRTKILSFALGAIISTGTPIGVAYAIDKKVPTNFSDPSRIPKKKQIVKIKAEPKKPLSADDLVDAISKNEIKIVDLKVSDFMTFVKAFKNETGVFGLYFTPYINGEIDKSKTEIIKGHLKVQDLLQRFLKTDNEIFRWLFSIIFNKGISGITREEIPKLKKLFEIFAINKKDSWLYKPWLMDVAKQLPILMAEGLATVLLENNATAFEKRLPVLIDYLIEKFVPKLKNKAQVKSKLIAFLRKVFITGYVAKKDQNGNIIKNAKEVIGDDLVELIYLFANNFLKEPLPEVKKLVQKLDVPIIGELTIPIQIPIKKILRSLVVDIITFMQVPTSEFIISKELKSLRESIANKNREIIKVEQEIKITQIKVNRLSISDSLKDFSSAQIKQLKTQISNYEKNNQYSLFLFSLGLDSAALSDVNKFDDPAHNKDYYDKPNKYLTKKWYEDKYKGYWVLARSLWSLYPETSKKSNYSSQEAWFAKIENDWKYGVTKAPWLWSSGGGPANAPDSNRLKKTIADTYGNEVLESLESKLDKIRDQAQLLRKNVNTPITMPSFKLSQWREIKSITRLEAEIEQKNVSIANLKQERAVLETKLKKWESSRSYVYESQNKITKKELSGNEFLKGKGLLKLSSQDLEKIFYKIQDLLINKDIYLDLILDQQMDPIIKEIINGVKNSPETDSKIKSLLNWGGATILKTIIASFKPEIKTKIKKDYITPATSKLIKKELVDKIRIIDPIQVAKMIHIVINNGVSNLSTSLIVKLVIVLQNFIKIDFSNQDLLNLIRSIKHGFHSIPTPNRVSLLLALIRFAPKEIREDKDFIAIKFLISL